MQEPIPSNFKLPQFESYDLEGESIYLEGLSDNDATPRRVRRHPVSSFSIYLKGSSKKLILDIEIGYYLLL